MFSHSVVKLHEAALMLMVFDYVSEMTVKKSCVGYTDCLSVCSSCYTYSGLEHGLG